MNHGPAPAGSAGLSLRGVIGLAIVIAYLAAVPLLAIVLLRLHQLRHQGAGWAQLAEASQWLTVALTCDGAAGGAIAEADLGRWRAGLEVVRRHGTALGPDLALRARVLGDQVDSVLAGPAPAHEPWVASHCLELAEIGRATLAQAIAMGTDPKSRGDRLEELAVRDVVAYAACWLGLGVALFVWARRRAVLPARRLARVLDRIASGDAEASIPGREGGEMGELVDSLRRAIDRFERDDRARREHMQEVRNVVRQLLEVVEDPALIIGVDERVDYANAAAGQTFGDKCRQMEGCNLSELQGGEQVRKLVAEVRAGGAAAGTVVPATELSHATKLAACAVVHDARGEISRVVLVFRAGSNLWQRLMAVADARG